MNTETLEIIHQIFARGTRVICENTDGPSASCEGRVAAAQENIIHINFLRGIAPDRIALVGQRVTIHRVTAASRYSAEAVRIENAVPGGLTIKVLDGPTKTERREYLRVRCQLPFQWRYVDPNDLIGKAEVSRPLSETRQELDVLARNLNNSPMGEALVAVLERLNRLEDKVERLMAKMQDDGNMREDIITEMSGGGMRFLTQRRVHAGDIIEAHMRFQYQDAEDDIRVQAKVLRIHPPNLGRSQPSVACRFIAVSPRNREAIIRYTFRIQREMLRRSAV